MRDPAFFQPYVALCQKAISAGIRCDGFETGLFFDGPTIYLYALVFEPEKRMKVVRLVDVPPEDIRDYVGDDDKSPRPGSECSWVDSIGRKSLPELLMPTALVA